MTKSTRLVPVKLQVVALAITITSTLLHLPSALAEEESPSTWGTNACQTVSCRFKAPNPKTPLDVAQSWHNQDTALWEYVNEHVPAVLDHTGAAAFDEHLKGVQAVLRHWNAPDHLVNAGLFHSIYGTEGFQGFALPLSQRSAIQSLIGEKAEKLAFVFCMLDRSSFDQTVFDWQKDNNNSTKMYNLRARPELGRFPLELTKEEWLDFVELTLADWLEQVEGAAAKDNPIFLWNKGEAFSYRRTAYAKMSQILAVERAPRLTQVAPTMVQNVYETEDPQFSHLVQMRVSSEFYVCFSLWWLSIPVEI